MNPVPERDAKPQPPRDAGIPELPDYEDEPMDSPNGEASQTLKRKILIWSVGILLLLACFPTAYRSLKNWRAEQLLRQSDVAFAVGDREEGVSLLKQALSLAPGNLSVQHSAELYNARAGDKTSVSLLLNLMRSGDATTEVLLGIAELKASSGEADICREALGRLSGKLSSPQKMRLILIEAALLAQQARPVEAASHCLEKNPDVNEKESVQLRIQAARYLLALRDARDNRQATDILLKILRAHSGESIVAWRMLSHVILSSPEENGQKCITREEAREVLDLFHSLPGRVFADRLLAAEVEIHIDPSSRVSVIKRLEEENRNASRTDQLNLARWLNANGLPDEVVALAGNEQVRNDTEWLLVVLDARCAQGKWNQVTELLNYPSATGVPDAVRHLFLSRAALMAGNTTVAAEELRNVAGVLPLEKPETLAYVAAYEERVGAMDQALQTYREMANRKETALPGLIALIRCQPRHTSAQTLIPLYEELLALSPELSEAVGDLAYLKLLQNKEVEPSAETSEKLLKDQPDILARISAAALGRLRLRNIQGATALYEGREIPWQQAPEAWRAVRVAVLRAAGDSAAADSLAATINPSLLRPEEKALLKKPEKTP